MNILLTKHERDRTVYSCTVYRLTGCTYCKNVIRSTVLLQLYVLCVVHSVTAVYVQQIATAV